MTEFLALTKRNIKLFFKDKGMLFTSLITPAILLVLYATFLANIYRDSFTSNLPEQFEISDKLINGCVGGQLVSSLLAVSCITVAFCSNFIITFDKVNGSRSDLLVSPLKKSTLALAYYAATAVNTLLVLFVAAALCFVYIACTGWYLSFTDVLLILSDVVILTMFGTVLSSIVNGFLSTQGQMSAVGTIVSAGYGFICGAYMPMSQFGEGLQNALMFLPGTYGTSLIRNHTLAGVFEEMSAQGFPPEVVEGIRSSIDCNLTFFGRDVSVGAMYAVMLLSLAALVAIYVAINLIQIKPARGKKSK